MSLLTITAPMLAAIEKYQQLGGSVELLRKGSEPSLVDAKIGKPISYGQIIDLSGALSDKKSVQDDDNFFELGNLLAGSQVYTGKAQSKDANTSDYDKLMARLRREEENRAYNQMIGKAEDPPTQSPNTESATSEDEMTYSDVNRQMTLIINVLVSIVTCSVAIWLVSRHLSTPIRLALSMSGSLVVAIAEVTIYSGYIRRLQEAKTQEKTKREMKVITETWVIEKSERREPVPVSKAHEKEQSGVRSRAGKGKV